MSTGPTLESDATVQGEAAVELMAARDAADAAAEADKAARHAAAEAEKSARQAASQAARAEKAAKALGTPRRRRRWLRGSLPRHSDTHDHGNPEIVTFSDLVRAHRAWEVELYERERHNRQPDKTIEREFHRKWRQFEGRYGRIDDAYWSVRDASAVALTMGQKDSRWLSRPEHVPRFHRATDWATRDEPETAAALDECETLAIRVEEILRGPSELIALRRINAVASHLLGSVDREWGRRPAPAAGRRTLDRTHLEEDKARIELQRRELERVERFYDRAGNGRPSRNHQILETVYSAGLRVSEFVGLNDGDLDFPAGIARIRGKGKRERLAPIGSYAVGALKAGWKCGSSADREKTGSEAPVLRTNSARG